MATPGYPGPTNTYVPNFAASQSLIVAFSRNPSRFPLPLYTQYVRAGKMVGFYFVWTSRQAARILTTDDAEHDWGDGNAAPTGLSENESGYWTTFTTKRKCYPFGLGRLAVEQADYPYLAAEGGVSSQQAMTARGLLTYNQLSTASWGSNTAAVNGGILAGGQTWLTGNNGDGTNQGPNIKQSLQFGTLTVNQQTIGAVVQRQLALVVNPSLAQGMARSTEIQDYIKQSPFALAQLRGDVPNQNGQWDLPTVLYNHPLAVEDTVRVTSKKGATTDVLTYVLPNTEAYLLARDGELEGLEGSRSFSTVQIFFYQDELTLSTFYDQINERYLGRVVSNFVPVVVAPTSGFRFTACQ